MTYLIIIIAIIIILVMTINSKKSAISKEKSYNRIKNMALINNDVNINLHPELRKYDTIRSYREGLSAVSITNFNITKYGFINRKYEEVIPLIYDSVEDFKNDIALVEINKKYGFLDLNNEIKLDIVYDSPILFKNRLAFICKDKKYGLLNSNCQTVTPIIYDSINEISNERYVVKITNNSVWPYEDRCGYLDQDGKLIIDIKFADANDFVENITGVKDALTGKWGFIDKNGLEVLPFIFNYIHNFKEGLCAVASNGKWGFINKDGKEFIKLVYDEIGEFNEGLCRVKKYKWGYVDKSGNLVIKCQYDYASDFNNGEAEVKFYEYCSAYDDECISGIDEYIINKSNRVLKEKHYYDHKHQRPQ